KPSAFPSPRPPETIFSAEVMSSCFDVSGTYCLNLARIFHWLGSTTTFTIFPCRPATRGVRAKDIGRTVAISGRCFSQRIVAIRFPPKEGRVAMHHAGLRIDGKFRRVGRD